MDPKSLQCSRILHRFWHGQKYTLHHTGKVSQIEEIVRLGRGGQQVFHGLFVDPQCTLHNLVHAWLEFIAESPVISAEMCSRGDLMTHALLNINSAIIISVPLPAPLPTKEVSYTFSINRIEHQESSFINVLK